MGLSLTAVILTRDESRHLARCIASLGRTASRVCVVDSGSTDGTVDLARSLGAEVFEHPFVNYADQFQWALDHCGVTTDWTLRIDADEYLTPELSDEMLARVPGLDPEITGVLAPRQFVFMGRPITHGFVYPIWHLRLFRTGAGRIEQRWMDEHIVLNHGRTVRFRHRLVDETLRDVTWWIDKHNHYATREMFDLAAVKYGASAGGRAPSDTAGLKRWLKETVYARLPEAMRVELYFAYRYWLGLGFLDGRVGRYYHFMHARWYRTLADMKLFEIEEEARRLGIGVPEAIRRRYGVDIG